MKVSELFGKRVLGTNGRDGYVVSVNAEGRNAWLVCADDNEREFAVDLKNVLSADDKIIYDGTEVKVCATPLRLGRAGFDMRGKYLGNLCDFTLSRGKLKFAKIGKKNYPADGIILGDIVIVKDLRRLKSDVKKDGKTLFKNGAYVTDEVLSEAAAEGEYVQTTLKTL